MNQNKKSKITGKGEAELDKQENPKIIDESKIPFINDIDTKADIAFFVDLMETYIKDLPESFSSLKLAIKNNNSGEVQFFAHKLKGGIITLGVESLAKICLDLEIAGKENHLDDEAKNNFLKLENDFDTLLKDLYSIKEKYSRLNK